jgi:hypothetical protein
MTLPIYPLGVRGLNFPVLKTHEFNTIVTKAPNFYENRLAQSYNPAWHFSLIYDYLKDDPTDLVAALAPYTDYRYLEGFLLSLQGQFGSFLFDDLTDDCLGMLSNPGGVSALPSSFKPSIYPTQEFYYPVGTIVVDDHTAPHMQQVTIPGISGPTVPTFATGGGTTVAGSVTFTEIGLLPGYFGQVLPLVTDGTFYYSPIQRTFGGLFAEDVTDLNQTVYPFVVWDNAVLKTSPSDFSILGPGLTVAGNSYAGLYLKWTGTPTGPITCLGQFYFRLRAETDEQDIEYFLRNLWTIGGTSSKNGSGMIKLCTARPDAA